MKSQPDTKPYLLFDGAMGTLIQQRSGRQPEFAEAENLDHPDLIRQIHLDYLDAGATAIKTNTFGCSRMLAELWQTEPTEHHSAAFEGQIEHIKAILSKGAQTALQAANEYGSQNDKDILVFGDLGAFADSNKSNAKELYIFQAGLMYQEGIRCFLAETLSDLSGIEQLAAFLASQKEPCFLLVSFAAGPDGMTRSGHAVRDLLEKAAAFQGVSAVGLNCLCGPHHMKALMENLKLPDLPFSVMPNAGYPSVLGRKVSYEGSPAYFASQMERMQALGASILGGCCGTTPDHIRALAEALPACVQEQKSQPYQAAAAGSHLDTLWEKVSAKRKVAAVELDPPKNDRIGAFMENISHLAHNGADFITIADNPIGRPRADSCLLACKIKRELGIDVLPHMTCRDRNLNAIKALLMGLSMEDLHSVLLVTGDPVPTELRDEVKSVFSFNSRKLAGYIRNLSPDIISTPFHLFGALNVNARNFDVQLSIARQKEEAGMCGFLSQPVHSKRALDHLKAARENLNGKILGGIFPIVSEKNALFLQNEVGGMDIDETMISLYAGKNRQEAEDLAYTIALETARAMSPYVDGYYIMTPFNRTGLVSRILAGLREEGLL